MRFLTLWLLVIFVLACFGVGSSLYHADNTINIYNITSRLEWNETLFDSSMENFDNITGWNMSTISMAHLKNVIFKGVDTMGFIAFEFARWGVEVGYENPEYNYVKTLKLIVYLLIFMCILTLFGVLIPILALIYLTYLGIKNLINLVIQFRKNRAITNISKATDKGKQVKKVRNLKGI